MGQEKGENSAMSYMLSGIDFGVVCSPSVCAIKARLSSDGHSRNGGLRRRRRRVQAALEGVAIAGVLRESWSNGILANIAASAGRITVACFIARNPC